MSEVSSRQRGVDGAPPDDGLVCDRPPIYGHEADSNRYETDRQLVEMFLLISVCKPRTSNEARRN